MIDLHSHILPNIDDGARNLEETYDLLQEAKDAGFEGVVSTSHYIEGNYEVPNCERQKLLEQIVKEKADVKLYLGNEIYLSENMITLLEEQKAATINGTRYVLFEMPLNAKPLGLDNIIYNMLQNKLVPVLAHPERYSFVQQNPQMVYELVEKGVLMQGNYGSIIGQYGKKAQVIMTKLLESNLIHFLGSDVHRAKSIYLKIPQIIEKLNQIVGVEKGETLTTKNPKLLLENKKIVVEELKKMKFSLKEKWILRS